jgi:hypothetical protein
LIGKTQSGTVAAHARRARCASQLISPTAYHIPHYAAKGQSRTRSAGARRSDLFNASLAAWLPDARPARLWAAGHVPAPS